MDFLPFRPARGGKLRHMLMVSAYYNSPILAHSVCEKQLLLELADIYGIKIPEPIFIPPKPIEPPTSFDNNLWIKKILGEPMIQKDYFVRVYKLEE